MDLDKLFSEMESEPRTVEVNCEIDNDLRIVTVPSDSMVFGVEHDKDVNMIHFTMNKMYRGIDLSDFSVRVTYKNANDEINFSEVNDVEKQENTFIFSWTVPNFACRYQGVIQFAVNFLKYDDEGKVLQAYNTTIAKGNCLIGLYVDSSDVPEGQYDDLISELNSLLIRTGNTQVDRVKDAGTAKISEIENTATTSISNINSTAQTALDNVEEAEATALDNIEKAAPLLPTLVFGDAFKSVTVGPNETSLELSGPHAPISAVITESVKNNPVIVEDSVKWPLQGMSIYGKCERVTTTGAQLIPFELYKPIETSTGCDVCIPLKDCFRIYFLKKNTSSELTSNDIYFVGRAGTDQGSFDDYSSIMPAGTYYYYISAQNFARLAVVCTTSTPNQNQTLVNLAVGEEGTFTVPENVKLRIFLRVLDTSHSRGFQIACADVKVIIRKLDNDVKYEPYTEGKARTILAYPRSDEYVALYNRSAQLLDIKNSDWITNNMAESSYKIVGDDYIKFEVVGRKGGPTNAHGVYIMPAWMKLIDFGGFHGYVSCDITVSKILFTSFGIMGQVIPSSDFKPNIKTHYSKKINGYSPTDLYLYFNGVHEGSKFDVLVENIMVTHLDHEVPYTRYVSPQFLKTRISNGFLAIKTQSKAFSNFVDKDGNTYVCNYRDYKRGVDVELLTIISIDPEKVEDGQNPLEISKEVRYSIPSECKRDIDLAPLYSNNFNYGTTWGYDVLGRFGYGSNAAPYELRFRIPIEADKKTYFEENPTEVVIMLAEPKETPIPEEDLIAYRSLHSYDGTTSVEVPGANDLEMKYIVNANQYFKNKFDSIESRLNALEANKEIMEE